WFWARRRRGDEPSDSTQAPLLLSRGTAHHRVRLGIYVVVLAAGGLSLLQAWQAGRSERQRAFDAEVANLAGAQRMLSQRIGRQVGAIDSQTGEPSAAPLRELARTLEQANRDALRLEQLLAQAKAADTDSQRQLALAWSGWRLAREQLWLAGSAMLAAAEADAPGPKLAQARAAVAALADPALHAAQQLVDSFAQLTRERHLSAVTAIRVWAAVNLILLALLAVGVAEPLARLVRRQYRRLADQTTELERLALVAERTSNLVMISDAAGRISWVNQAFSRISGHSEQAAQGQDPLQLLFGAGSPADALATAKLRAAMAGGASLRQQIAIKPLQGPVVWLDLDSQPLRGADGQAKGFVHVGLDVTERRQALLDARVAAIAFDSQEAMMITDAAQHIVKVNPAFTRITGYGAGEALGRRPGELLQSGRQGEAFYARMLQALSEQHHWQGEIWNRRKNGEIFPEWLSITAVCDEQGTARHYVAVFSDITQKKQAEQAIHDLAFYDPLTELPNRRLLHDRLQQTMAASARHGSEAALLFLDLDHFKVLNDSKGHDYGDLLLIEVARRLRDSV
ncbi:MAG: PAS domain S-box protein, partial [Rubrivivax sp.]|nr:PAS domain S-box protein [Rubrivivax sp.]